MQIQERLIVPGLGVIILLAAFILGVPLVYKLLLGLLGLAASATYFAPHAVQVETRIGIAALGLIILLIVSSTAFWLILLSFGAIAALQIQHRHTLQRSLATVAWLNAVLERRSWARAGEAADGGSEEEAGAVATAGDGESVQAPTPSEVGSLPAFVRMNVGGIGGSVFGALSVLGVFMPWVLFLVAYRDESESTSLTLLAASEELDSILVLAFFGILLVLALLSAASIVLPRAVAGFVAVAGLIVSVVSYLSLFGQLYGNYEDALGGSIPSRMDIITLPNLGLLLAVFCFLVIPLLQLIPFLNRPRG